ncbi:hypothetical protein PHMEG_00023880 [Phytophthora megakarya]|uniref:Uncharacterized protein n=1 Tax=Phytophthora megakarya TaxID=4795 RepID=A0A225VHJ2_9STRA|nr:hypothetical protein PHMEG_00023880 [Phytophthora megakarya]
MSDLQGEDEFDSDSVREGSNDEEDSGPQEQVDGIPLAQTEQAVSEPSTPVLRGGSSPVETRSRFNAKADAQLVSKVLAKPPFGVTRGKVKGIWERIAARLNSELSTGFTARACRDRTSHLLNQHVARQKKNQGASGTSEVHSSNDDALEELLKLRQAASDKKREAKARQESRADEMETAGERLMHAAETRVAERLTSSSSSEEKGAKRRRLSVLLESEQQETVARRQLEEPKVDMQSQELQLRRDELEEQRKQRELMQVQIQQQTKQTEMLMTLLSSAISQTKEKQ